MRASGDRGGGSILEVVRVGGGAIALKAGDKPGQKRKTIACWREGDMKRPDRFKSPKESTLQKARQQQRSNQINN